MLPFIHKFCATAGLSLIFALPGNAAPLFGAMADWQKVLSQGKAIQLLQIDNDSLLLKKDDGFYTSGMRYEMQHRLTAGGQSTSYNWHLGHQMYTASDIKLPPGRVAPPDHPYAAWLFGGVSAAFDRDDGSHYAFGLDAGCLGPCAGGEWTQTHLHRLLQQPLPQGWSKQVRNEFGLVVHGEVAPLRWKLTPQVDLTPRVQGRFGNIFTDVSGDLLVRAGTLNLLPDQPAFHAFGRLSGRAVGFNATLQGGYFSNQNQHTVKPKTWVGEAEIGLVWRDGPYGFNASIVRRTNEIRDLPNQIGMQNYARLEFAYAL